MSLFTPLVLLQETVVDRPVNFWEPSLASAAPFTQEPIRIQVRILPDKAVIEVVQLFRNRTESAASAPISLTVARRGEAPGRAPAWQDVRWKDQPVQLDTAGRFQGEIPAKGWASLKAKIDLPLAAYGPDRIQRSFQIALPAQAAEAGGSVSADFRQGLVHRLIGMEPRPWKYTLDGASLGLNGLRGPQRLFLSWWRGGFGPIGGGA